MIAGTMLALLVGWQLGTGSLFGPLVLCGGLAYILIVTMLRCHWEALFMGLLVLGYLVGNRGFAQLMPPGLPMLPAEAGVLVVSLALILRIPLERDFSFRLTPLTVFIAVWMATSSAHMIFDLSSSGFLAIRDFAMVYYAVFFFGGMTLAKREQSIRIIEWALGIGFALMAVGYLLYLVAPEMFHQIRYRSSPVIYYKGDLVGIFAAAGIFFYYGVSTRCSGKLEKIGLTLLMGLSAGVLFLTLARSAMVGAAIGLCIMVIAGHWRILPRLLLVGVLGSALVIAVDISHERRLAESQLYAVFEHGVSLVDFAGSYDYQNPESKDTGDNNRFRLVWWRSLTEHVLENGPVQGLGFGYDLANPFIQEYYPQGNETFRTRSPHNFLLSVFGRTGMIGIFCWVLILGAMTNQAWRLVRKQKAREPLQPALIFLIMAWTIFFGALFQVVLEGPMGAVLFWLLLGLSQMTLPKASEETTDEKALAAENA
ncbi:O-antigen ligase family protein [Cerasicoccus arenae]|uniref:O-antigen ligase-related domain-containing protein n=1 Tax=Cerasicoccus arenae TaxID=424488 RepID=A0A8J3DCQ7_9BACT|nr:O-antigen ligase family protein [Cerasicoccus arenae]MBK1858488.1 O-antigen ligase family protein [Cerasicoccus arenae]GHC10338.1 hypothetical protein GCM10007047_29590 [Cerasicoccus arenae]